MSDDSQITLLSCRESLESLNDDVLPIIRSISKHTIKARKAMGGGAAQVDTLTLSNEQIELAILNQRIGERVAAAGALAREAKFIYESTREGYKVMLTKGYVGDDGETVKPVAAGVADSMKMSMVKDEFDLYNAAEHLREKLKFLRESTEETIGTIRTKISFEKQDYRNA